MIAKISTEVIDNLISNIEKGRLAKLEIKEIEGEFVADFSLEDEGKLSYTMDVSVRAINILNGFKHAFEESRVQKFSFSFSPESSLVSSAYLPTVPKPHSGPINPLEHLRAVLSCIVDTDTGSRIVDLFHKEPPSGKKQNYKQATVHSSLLAIIEGMEK